MEHPYKEYENSKTWNAVARLIKDLVDNNDIELLSLAISVKACRNRQPKNQISSS